MYDKFNIIKKTNTSEHNNTNKRKCCSCEKKEEDKDEEAFLLSSCNINKYLINFNFTRNTENLVPPIYQRWTNEVLSEDRQNEN